MDAVRWWCAVFCVQCFVFCVQCAGGAQYFVGSVVVGVEGSEETLETEERDSKGSLVRRGWWHNPHNSQQSSAMYYTILYTIYQKLPYNLDNSHHPQTSKIHKS